MVACNQQLLPSPTYVHLYVQYILCTYVCLCNLTTRLYTSLEISCIHLYVQEVVTNGDEIKEPKTSKQEVCLCVCWRGGGGVRVQHLTL